MIAVVRPGARASLLTLLSAALLFAVITGCLARFDALRHAGSRHEKLYLPSGLFLREATAGFREVAADWLWFQAVQYYGEYRLGRHDLAYFKGMIQAVNTLDPRFLEAYRFGALVLATDMEDVAGGVDVLKRGIQAVPGRWILTFELGFLHYIMTRDHRRAAVWFEAASAAPDASDFARRFAAFARRRAGDLEVSLALWRNLRDSTQSPAMRELAETEMARIEAALRDRPGAVAPEGAVP